MSEELEALKKKVDDLQALVHKQNLLISKTGQNVLELQLERQKKDVNNFSESFSGSRASSNIPVDTTELATNEDLVELVGELQGELATLEERSIRRLVNSTKTEPNDVVAPLPNADGDTPSLNDDFFPKSLEEFNNLSNVHLFRLAKFYELVAPTLKEKEDFENYLEGKIDNLHINEMTDADVQREIERMSKDELDDAFNDLARYLGIRTRRGTNIW